MFDEVIVPKNDYSSVVDDEGQTSNAVDDDAKKDAQVQNAAPTPSADDATAAKKRFIETGGVIDLKKEDDFTPINQVNLQRLDEEGNVTIDYDDDTGEDEDGEVITLPGQSNSSSSVVGTKGDDDTTGDVQDNDDNDGQQDTPPDRVADDPVIQTLQQQGLLVVPELEDGVEPTVEQIVEASRQRQLQLGQQALLQNVKNEQGKKVLEHLLRGGDFTDVKSLVETVEAETAVAELDPSNIDHAKQIFNQYYKERGLDEDAIGVLLETALERNSLEKDAGKLHGDLKKSFETKRQTLEQEAVQKQQQIQQQVAQYEQSIAQTFQERQFSDDIAKGVQGMLSYVGNGEGEQIFHDDGRPMYYWEAQLETIRNNPQHLLDLMSVMHDYDPEKGFTSLHTRQEKNTKTAKTKTELEALNRLRGNNKKSRRNSNKPNGGYMKPL